MRNGAESLYDLARDPDETRPSTIPVTDGRWRHCAQRSGTRRTGPAASPGPGGPPTASAEELAAIERQMKLLGYM